MKLCNCCGETKPDTDFYKRLDRTNGLKSECKVCLIKKRKPYYIKHKVQARQHNRKSYSTYRNEKRRYHLEKRYGITLDQYEELFQKQEGVCFICQKPPTDISLAVEHDHKTQEIRGLCCYRCNRFILGKQRDPLLFERAALYLRQPHTGWFVPVRKKKRKKRNR